MKSYHISTQMVKYCPSVTHVLCVDAGFPHFQYEIYLINNKTTKDEIWLFCLHSTYLHL